MSALNSLLPRLERVTGPDAQGWYTARCPAHHDDRPSLRLREGSNGPIIKCLAGCPPEAVYAALGLPAPSARLHGGDGRGAWPQEPEAAYDYRDGAGRLLFQVCRFPGKRFRQRRPDGNGGWAWSLDGVRRVPYQLPVLLGADLEDWLFAAEGEKDCNRLASLGLVATTNPGGAAGKWPPDWGPYFEGRKVAILPDNDAPGKAHAEDVARKLAPYAALVKVVELPGLPPKGDVSDWLAAGHTAQELVALVEGAPNLTSNLKGAPLEVKFKREVNAAELQAQGGPEALPYLPLLGREGFLVKGWSHLVAGYPKGGKTELLTSLCHEWGALGETVLYLTEEPESIWRARLSQRPPGWEHVTLVFALGMRGADVLERIQVGHESVVVIDTVRNLLGFSDETDNSEIARALIPYIDAARQEEKTIIFVHHDRKGGGEHGEAIAGGHAFLGVVDVALELRRDPQSPRRRQVRGWGRIIQVPELVYELAEDGSFRALGEPIEVALEAVKERAMEALAEEWATTKAVHELLGEPKPSREQLRQALYSLAQEGKVERDPPLSEGQKQGSTYRWRSANLTSNGAPL